MCFVASQNDLDLKSSLVKRCNSPSFFEKAKKSPMIAQAGAYQKIGDSAKEVLGDTLPSVNFVRIFHSLAREIKLRICFRQFRVHLAGKCVLQHPLIRVSRKLKSITRLKSTFRANPPVKRRPRTECTEAPTERLWNRI